MRKDQFSALSCTNLFKGIQDDEMDKLIETAPPTIRTFHKDAVMSFQGDEYNELMIILAGELSAEILNPNGKKIIIETLNKSSAVATGVLFAEDNTLPVTLKVVKEVEIALFTKKTVLKFCQMNERFLLNYMQDMGDKVIFLAEKIRLFRFKSINQKVAGYLLNLSIKQGADSVRMTYSLEHLADLFGIARPSLSRVLSEFYDQAILKKEGRIMHILDKQELEYMLEGE
ncbi:MAG: Crp/Fnr family transcriptional regulator [Spirochaetales bacterium]|nr:Crp/Fnr family transcriptional regulator [Spirochaetales bacterium]